MAVINDDAFSSTASPVSPPRPSLTLLALFSQAVRDPAQRVTVIGGLICLALFGILFRDNLWHFYYAWTTDDNYSHGFLVPLLSLYFASQIVRRGPVEIQSGVMSGGGPAGACSHRYGWSRFPCRFPSWATSRFWLAWRECSP